MNIPDLAERLLRRDRIVLISLIGALFAVAAVYTVFGIGMRMSALEMTAMGNMPMQDQAVSWSPTYALLVFLMWWVMMMAMMLPSASPTVLLYATLLRRGADAERVPAITVIFLAGYLAAWAGFSLAAVLVQWVLEMRGILSPSMMTLIKTAPGAFVLIAAGAYQFTPLKQACLRHCRSPVHFIANRRRHGMKGAFAMGLEHGVYCLGCCWSLMVLLFVGGIMNLYWIVGLAVLVAVEKLTPYGSATSRIAGVALIAWGAAILVGTI